MKGKPAFSPNPKFIALLDGYSGNAVNGVNESDQRRPKMVWWAPDPDAAPFGAAQKWFYQQEEPDEEMTTLREQRQRVIKEELRPQKDIKLNKSNGDWSRALETFIAAGDCEMTGCTALQPEWIFDHEATDLPNIVMLGFQHDFEELKHVPEIRGAKDVTRQYVRAAACANKVTNFIRETGYRAEPVTGPMTGKVAMIPPAIACGFGELGKHGSIINPEFGSAFRLSAVLTDAPIPFTEQREFGIDDVCTRCRVCENACPPAAISPDKQLVRGAEKWYVDFDKCIPYFAETSGCAICIAVCPWSLPGVGISMAEKVRRRATRKDLSET